MRNALLACLPLSLLIVVCVACGDSGGHEHGHDHDGDVDEGGPDGIDTGATCPEDSELTYANFGEKFMNDYCVSCHSSELSGDERNGAPSDHDLDSRQGIINSNLEHISLEAAGGPNGFNRDMPEDGPEPTDDERLKLGEWLACGVP